MTDPHAPARFRINGPLANMPKFSEVKEVENWESSLFTVQMIIYIGHISILVYMQSTLCRIGNAPLVLL